MLRWNKLDLEIAVAIAGLLIVSVDRLHVVFCCPNSVLGLDYSSS